MSASLVGSEMCIRDSQRAKGELRGVPGRSRELCEASESFGELLGSSRTVSYTHLTLPTICSV
eukprot:123335-Alexandrium_andersonii.AAC.1